MRGSKAGLLLLALLTATLSLSAQDSGPMTRNEFVALVNAKTPAADLITQIRARGYDFEITADLETALQQVEGGPDILAALREPGSLEVSVSMEGAEVLVDGQSVPVTGTTVTAANLAPGNHLVRVQAPRYVMERLQVFLKPGERRRVEVALTSSVEVKPGLLGLELNVRAGTEEDKLVSQLDALADPARRVARLQEVLQSYADTPMALLAHRQLQAAYLEQQKYDESLAAGRVVLERDPNNFLGRLREVQAYLGKGDLNAAFDGAVTCRRLLVQAADAPAPEGTNEQLWQTQKRHVLEAAEAQLQSLAYDFFVGPLGQTDAAAKSRLLERFLEVYPQSEYRQSALVNLAYAYQQQGNAEKMIEWGNRALEGNPDEASILVLVSDTLTDRGVVPPAEDRERAEELAGHLLELLTASPDKVRPAGISDEQWAGVRALWEGTAHSVLGQILMFEETATAPRAMSKTREAIEHFRQGNPLLKNQTQYYARNLFRLGFAQAKVGDLAEARSTLADCIALGTPYTAPAQDTLNKVEAALQRRQP